MTTPFDTDAAANTNATVITLPASGLQAIKSRLHLSMTNSPDGPVFTGSGMPVSQVSSTAVLLMPDLTLSLPDPNLSGATIALTPALPGDRLSLGEWRSDNGQAFTSASGRITGSYLNGTLILIGLATLAEYQGLLRALAHDHDGSAAAEARSIAVRVTDSDPATPETIPVAVVMLTPSPDGPEANGLVANAIWVPYARPIAAVESALPDPVAATLTPLPDVQPVAEMHDAQEAHKEPPPAEPIILTGTDGDDHLSTAGVDHVRAMGGDDIITLAEGTAPDIIIDGGAGEDVVLLTERAATLAPVEDDQIVDVETVSAVALEIEAVIDMNAQSEGFAILGGSGGDRLKGGRNDDLIHSGAGDDRVEGGDGDDALHGGTGDDRIDGDDGDDWISGGRGADTLTGGDGNDVFHFDEIDDHAPDIITDFRPGDRIALTGSTYLQGLSNETLETGSWFWQGATAQNAETRILYDTETGYLIYASDGDGEGSSYVRIARLGDDDEDRDDCSAAHLSISDFLIV